VVVSAGELAACKVIVGAEIAYVIVLALRMLSRA
jgi:hypothetical protein